MAIGIMALDTKGCHKETLHNECRGALILAWLRVYLKKIYTICCIPCTLHLFVYSVQHAINNISRMVYSEYSTLYLTCCMWNSECGIRDIIHRIQLTVHGIHNVEHGHMYSLDYTVPISLSLLYSNCTLTRPGQTRPGKAELSCQRNQML